MKNKNKKKIEKQFLNLLKYLFLGATPKGCVRYIFASFFYVLRTAFGKHGKMFFISSQKLFSFTRKSIFIILDIQIS